MSLVGSTCQRGHEIESLDQVYLTRTRGHRCRECVLMHAAAAARGERVPRVTSLDRAAQRINFTLGCWTWTAAKGGSGYGNIRVAGEVRPAHRFIYEALVGPIPPGMELDHLCRNRACVRPDHLEPVTHRENVLRGESVVASNARGACCPNGHDYALDSYVDKHGHRRCRPCQRARNARWESKR